MKIKLLLICFTLSSLIIHAKTWKVGPARTHTYCSQVASLVQNGDTIEIDAATYVNDPQVIWSKNNLYITGVGGRPHLEAGSIIANDMVNGKGIFVISGSNVHVNNIAFANAVVQSHNGAGIRQEGANLLVTHCKFDGNEMGILGGNIANCKTTVEYCEFLNGGSVANPGYQHNIYINHIDSFVFRYNYSHDAIAEGHELKSRATYNFILYNRIANETTADSRCIDLPNGGTAVITGNIIEQGQNSVNSNLVGYGLEGLINSAPHKLYCTNNTFVNKKTTGSFIQLAAGTELLFAKNNIFAGAKTGGVFIGTPTVLDSLNNLIDNAVSSFGFVDPAGFDYHLKPGSVCIDKGITLSEIIAGHALMPSEMYKDSCDHEKRMISGNTPDIGAYEFSSLSVPSQLFSSLLVYPNPASSLLYIDARQGMHFSVRLITPQGQEVIELNNCETRNILDVSCLPKGFYLLQLEDADRSFVRKIIIE